MEGRYIHFDTLPFHFSSFPSFDNESLKINYDCNNEKYATKLWEAINTRARQNLSRSASVFFDEMLAGSRVFFNRQLFCRVNFVFSFEVLVDVTKVET